MKNKIKQEPVYDDDIVNKKYVDKKINELKELIKKLQEQKEG